MPKICRCVNNYNSVSFVKQSSERYPDIFVRDLTAYQVAIRSYALRMQRWNVYSRKLDKRPLLCPKRKPNL
jgi:hypothetical protein